MAQLTERRRVPGDPVVLAVSAQFAANLGMLLSHGRMPISPAPLVELPQEPSDPDARRVLDVLPKRFAKYGLRLHPDKTRLVRFERPQNSELDRKPPHELPRSFDFLGFTHYWEKSRRGKWTVKRRTASDHARLASGGWPPLPGRIRTYQVHYEGFPVLSIAFSFPPSQAWPGARHIAWHFSARFKMPPPSSKSRRDAGRVAVWQPLWIRRIGIGGEPHGSHPSHTTVRTGPYTAVRLVKPLTRFPASEDPWTEGCDSRGLGSWLCCDSWAKVRGNCRRSLWLGRP
jgi:hypothetical protein